MNAVYVSVFLKVRHSRFMPKSCMVSHVPKYLLVLKEPGLLLSFEFPLQLFSDCSVYGYLVLYGQPLEGKCNFSFTGWRSTYFLPTTHPLLHLPFIPVSLLLKMKCTVGKGLESGLGSELQLKANSLISSGVRMFVVETVRGMEQLVCLVLAWVLREQLSPYMRVGINITRII